MMLVSNICHDSRTKITHFRSTNECPFSPCFHRTLVAEEEDDEKKERKERKMKKGKERV